MPRVAVSLGEPERRSSMIGCGCEVESSAIGFLRAPKPAGERSRRRSRPVTYGLGQVRHIEMPRPGFWGASGP